MVAKLELRFDSRDLEIWRDRKVEAAVTRAVAKAGSDAIRAIRIDSSREVRAKKRLKLGQVNKSLVVFYPTNRRELSSLVWRMDVSGKPIPVIDYPGARKILTTKKRGGGVGVTINQGGQRKVIRSAFVAVMKSGHKGVFRRTTKGGPRLPIKELYTTKVSDVFKDSGFVPSIYARAQVVFGGSVERNLKIELDKIKVGGH